MSTEFSFAGRKIWVAGHRGMVGGALVRRLERENCKVLTVGREEVDLSRQQAVEDWVLHNRPDVIFLAAARVGGILANSTRPGEFLYDNLVIETNIVEAARRAGVAKLLFLGSSCIYPGRAPQPMAEDALLTGPLEETNQWYAIAKIAGLMLTAAYRRQYGCDFIAAMPTNLYGPGDNFDPNASHVLPALIMKAHQAKIGGARKMVIWGSGTPRREFLHVDDCADALVFLAKHYSGETHVNVGAGSEISILELAKLVGRIVGFTGKICTDPRRPDGPPRKWMDSSRLRALGWASRIELAEGIATTYRWYLDNADHLRGR